MNYIAKLFEERRELALLQWTYFVMSILAVLIAGIFALFNQSLGVSMLVVPLVAITAASMNVVAWALIKLAAETFLPKPKAVKTTKASKKAKK